MENKKPSPKAKNPQNTRGKSAKPKNKPAELEKEHGGFDDLNLPEPTRYGDWEVKGRCSDF